MGEDDDGGKATSKKATISEEDVSQLLQRYSPTTILAFLQEVYQFAGVKIDWHALVKKTSTGITSARECQMLWRHLAYHDPLLGKLEDNAEPLGDDSDLEFEVEAVPATSCESSLEAAACVKVLISSGSQHETCPASGSTVEAPLTINIPNRQTSHVPLDKQQLARCSRGVNITVPVSVQKQLLQTGLSGDLDENVSSGSTLPSKKKRKLWTKEEDMELIAAVQKCGEGNWANILKGDFKHNRTASQLSQRWSAIRKRQANSKPGITDKSINSTRSEERLAALKAFSLAVDMPMSRSLATIISGATQSSTLPSSSTTLAPLSESQPISTQAPNQSQLASSLVASQKGTTNHLNKPRTIMKKQIAPSMPLAPTVMPCPAVLVPSASSVTSSAPHVIPPACPNSSIQAAAFAAGGRMAAPSTAASLLRAAQSKSAVHIIPVGGALQKSPGAGGKSLPGTNMASLQNLGAQARRNQPVLKSPSLNSCKTLLRPGSQQTRGFVGRPVSSSATSSLLASNDLTQSGIKSIIDMRINQENGGASNAQENVGIKTCKASSAMDSDELLREEDRGADEMEVDGSMAQDHLKSARTLDMEANQNHVVNDAVDSQGTPNGDADQLKSGIVDNHNVINKEETRA